MEPNSRKKPKRAKKGRKASDFSDAGSISTADGDRLSTPKSVSKSFADDFIGHFDMNSEAYFDSDDDAGDLNRSGNVPLKWYQDEDHIGYNVEGAKLKKLLDTTEIGKFIFNTENPDAWRTVVDPRNNRQIRLTDDDLKLIQRVSKGMYPIEGYNQQDLYVEFDNEDSIHPVSYTEAPKRQFLPSKHEAKKIARLVQLIKSGKIKPPSEQPDEDDAESDEEVVDIWGDAIYSVDLKTAKRGASHEIRAPKTAAPTHAESYNPPPEYLFDEEELKEWLETDPVDRKMDFIPRSHKSLREVGVYKELIAERFKRCLQLYLCPRAVKLKMNIDPDSLLPKLPDINDLKPFPTRISVEYKVCNGAKSIAVDPSGRWLAAIVADGKSLDIFDVTCGRRVYALVNFENLTRVFWHPLLPILGIVDDQCVILIATDVDLKVKKTTLTLEKFENAKKLLSFNDNVNGNTGWSKYENNAASGNRVGVSIKHKHRVVAVDIHPRGNYLVATCASLTSIEQCLVHCLPKKATMKVGNKVSSNQIKRAMFHPIEPKLIVAFTHGIRFYNLKASAEPSTGATAGGKKLPIDSKKLNGIDQCIDLHINAKSNPLLIAADQRGQAQLFDLELGGFAYKKFSFQGDAIASVKFHSQFPLLCIAMTNGICNIYHCKNANDEDGADGFGNIALVPLKQLKAPGGCVDAQWHPTEAHLFTATAKGVFKWV